MSETREELAKRLIKEVVKEEAEAVRVERTALRARVEELEVEKAKSSELWLAQTVVLGDTTERIAELEDALQDLLHICNSRGESLGLDEGGPVLDKARAALARRAPCG